MSNILDEVDKLITLHLNEIKAGHDSKLREGFLRILDKQKPTETKAKVGAVPSIITLDEIVDNLVIETIDQANEWYGHEAPHDVNFYDHTVPEAEALIQALITEAVANYQTEHEQRHIASAIKTARIGEAYKFAEITRNSDSVGAIAEKAYDRIEYLKRGKK